MSTSCIDCIKNERTGQDGFCNECRDIRHSFYTSVLGIRDYLDPVVEGTIQKARKSSQYSINPEYRKTMLKDAREIAEHAQKMLDILAGKIWPRTKGGPKGEVG